MTKGSNIQFFCCIPSGLGWEFSVLPHIMSDNMPTSNIVWSSAYLLLRLPKCINQLLANMLHIWYRFLSGMHVLRSLFKIRSMHGNQSIRNNLGIIAKQSVSFLTQLESFMNSNQEFFMEILNMCCYEVCNLPLQFLTFNQKLESSYIYSQGDYFKEDCCQI